MEGLILSPLGSRFCHYGTSRPTAARIRAVYSLLWMLPRAPPSQDQRHSGVETQAEECKKPTPPPRALAAPFTPPLWSRGGGPFRERTRNTKITALVTEKATARQVARVCLLSLTLC